jgi:hypothetical protein
VGQLDSLTLYSKPQVNKHVRHHRSKYGVRFAATAHNTMLTSNITTAVTHQMIQHLELTTTQYSMPSTLLNPVSTECASELLQRCKHAATVLQHEGLPQAVLLQGTSDMCSAACSREAHVTCGAYRHMTSRASLHVGISRQQEPACEY